MSFLDLKKDTNPAQVMVIDSRNRLPKIIIGGIEVDSTPSHFQIILPTDIRNIKQALVADVRIPYTWNNVDSTNNQFGVDIGGVLTIYALPLGGYDAIALCVAISASIGTQFECTFNVNTKKVTIRNKALNAFSLIFDGIPNTIHNIIGFNKAIYGPDTQFDAPNILNLSDFDYLLIKCKPLISDTNPNILLLGNTIDKNVLCMVPVTSNPGEILNGSVSHILPTAVNISDVQITTLEIILTKPKTDVGIELNGTNWTLSIYVFTT